MIILFKKTGKFLIFIFIAAILISLSLKFIKNNSSTENYGVPREENSNSKNNSEFLITENSENNSNFLVNENWAVKFSMPTPRSGAASAVVDGKIYVIGGYSGLGQFSVNERYDPETNTWDTLTPMPKSRSGAVAAVVDGKIYVIGGVDKDNNILSLNECYDLKTNNWTVLTSMPTPRAVPAIGVVNNKIYVIGGGDGNLLKFKYTNEMYDPLIDKWTVRKPMPTARSRPVFSVINNKIYVIGGWANDGITNKNEVYDPETDVWTSLSPMPTPRTAAVAVSLNNKIYVIGGYSLEENSEKSFNEKIIFFQNNEEYNVNFNKWINRLSMSEARAGIVGGLANDKIYIIGGVSDYGFRGTINYSNLNEEYTLLIE